MKYRDNVTQDDIDQYPKTRDSFKDCHFEGLCLSNNKFIGCNFEGSVFVDCDFTGGYFSDCNMRYVEISECCMVNISLSRTILADSYLGNVDLSYSILDDANFNCSILKEVDLDYSNLNNTNFTNTLFKDVSLSEVEMMDTIGNGRNIYTLQTDRWTAVHNGSSLQIGCKRKSIEEWLKMDEEQIAKLDLTARWFDKKWREVIIKWLQLTGGIND